MRAVRLANPKSITISDAAFDEDQLGRISAGGLADFLILDRDIMDPRNCSDAAILDTVVEMAYLGAERIVG